MPQITCDAVYNVSDLFKKRRKKERNPLQEGMWRTSGPQRVYNPIGDRGTKGLYPGSAFMTSFYLHLYVMVVFSGARVVRVL